MIHWSLAFLALAITSVVLGFSGIAGIAAMVAKALFLFFLVLFLTSFLAGPHPQ